MTDDDGARRASIAVRLAAVRGRIARAEEAAGRGPGSVRLLLATKIQPVELVRAAVAAGADLVGENRVQELVAKGPDLADRDVEVHLIGHLQANKVNQALRWATCVESVDSLALARRLSQRCEAADRDLDVLVQVNVSGETTKFGVVPGDAEALAVVVAALPRLRLRGFMTIGARSTDEGVVRAGFARLREVRDAVVGSRAPGTAGATGLSMGMSGDLELAVAEGSTIVRIGTAVFGARG
ncbi:YggS family pyridoxal phosphate-dependent enzyme [Cellulomonas fimi]|uniref:Pyridoxal phosphate homeostasis protein n=1 Tax=Cellulomonas fimi TaxID=1708 RepID=A0A7Y0M1Q0_CELFI|nr:YggS family pyridoxal phosphate-dependent enzyme [Cellulomonas fimi]NMR21448.1 YggS family pyridoxal phosphate-dependent enzyme [Cellulomonas fimi]